MYSKVATFIGRAFVALSPIAFCFIAPPGIYGQNLRSQNTGIIVAMDWHTMAAPTFGVAYRYAWNDIVVRDGNGNDLPATLDLQVKSIELGDFDLKTRPIAVPGSGMIITFTRSIEMHPTDAERGTMLWNDPLMNWRNSPDGPMRAIFAQRVDVIDATTNKVLMRDADWYRIGITRLEILYDIVHGNKVAIDLTPFAGQSVVLRARIISGYNGRGPSNATIPTLTFIQSCIHPQDLR